MDEYISKLAFQGKWSELLKLLRSDPDFINCVSESKGYSPLHQAAWHGADLNVIGELLALGADRDQKTLSKRQNAQEIAEVKHPERTDLQYLLAPGKRSIAQLLRKLHSDTPPVLFGLYDGNKIVFDRMVELFNSDFAYCFCEDVETRIENAFKAITGSSLISSHDVVFQIGGFEGFSANSGFWKTQILPALADIDARSNVIPIEQSWAVVSDLFDPAPEQWGYRGEFFLWMEMRQALSRVEIPQYPQLLEQIISSAFSALTGATLERCNELEIKRYGGVKVGREFWSTKFIPLVQQRAQWLQKSWQRIN